MLCLWSHQSTRHQLQISIIIKINQRFPNQVFCEAGWGYWANLYKLLQTNPPWLTSVSRTIFQRCSSSKQVINFASNFRVS